MDDLGNMESVNTKKKQDSMVKSKHSMNQMLNEIKDEMNESDIPVS